MYPVFLKLDGLPCLVVGGGSVALRKTGPLLSAGASVTVLSDRFISEFDNYPAAKLINEKYRKGFASGFKVVIAATDDDTTNSEVYADAIASGSLINVADKPELCNFFVPAILDRGRLKIAVCTEGGFPALSAKIKTELEELYPERYEQLVDKLTELRNNIQAVESSHEKRMERCRKIAASEAICKFLEGDDNALEGEFTTI